LTKINIDNLTFSVIGYGRFGKLWVDILSEYGSVLVYENNTEVFPDEKKNIHFVNLKTALKQDVIFLCIPISAMESFIKEMHLIFLKMQRSLIWHPSNQCR